MDIFELQPRLEALENLAREKYRHIDNSVYVEATVNLTANSPIVVKLWSVHDGVENQNFYPKTSSDIEDALDDIRLHLESLPDPEILQRNNAVKQLSDALAACADAGIDTEPFREPFHNIYENLLEAPDAAAV